MGARGCPTRAHDRALHEGRLVKLERPDAIERRVAVRGRSRSSTSPARGGYRWTPGAGIADERWARRCRARVSALASRLAATGTHDVCSSPADAATSRRIWRWCRRRRGARALAELHASTAIRSPQCGRGSSRPVTSPVSRRARREPRVPSRADAPGGTYTAPLESRRSGAAGAGAARGLVDDAAARA